MVNFYVGTSRIYHNIGYLYRILVNHLYIYIFFNSFYLDIFYFINIIEFLIIYYRFCYLFEATFPTTYTWCTKIEIS